VPRIAVLNAGSSSIKFALFEGKRTEVLFTGQIEQIGVAPRLTVKNSDGEREIENEWQAAELDHRSGTRVILETAIALLGGEPVAGVGHRVVHGGTRFAAPTLVTRETIAALKDLCPLAPLHQPHNLAAIEAIAVAAPHIPQVACFDTAFHQAQPPLAQMYALPRALTDSGIRRYGFHGLSYEFVSTRLQELAPKLAAGRVIIAHLGNGASLCATRGGKSVATTMGFTAIDGLMMGTRSGSIDPGVLLYLMDERQMDARVLERLLYKESGLLGVSGISSDMRTLRVSGHPHAHEAMALFAYRIVREIGSLAATLGGVDGIVFTGGIGQHDGATRKDVIAGCRWLGAELDLDANKRNDGRIDAPCSSVPIWVIPTDEERVIARHTLAVLDGGKDISSRRAPRAFNE
jgi:acetate kinase